MQRWSGEKGQAALEYVALVLALLAAAIALAGAGPWAGRALAPEVAALACEVVGARCGDLRDRLAPGRPEAPCLIAAASRELDASVVLAAGTLGGGIAYVREKRSDGRVAITLRGAGRGGLLVALGAVQGAAGELRASAEGGLAGVAAATWSFATDAEANAFAARVRGWVGRSAVSALPGGELAEPALGLVGGGSGDRRPLPRPDEVFGQLAARAEASADASLAELFSGEGRLSAGRAIGAAHHAASGETTIHFELDERVALGASRTVLGRPDIDRAQSARVALTLDAAGRPLRLGLSAQATTIRSGGLGRDARAAEGTRRGALGAVTRLGATRDVVWQATLDIREPAGRSGAATLLAAIGARPRAGVPGAEATAALIRALGARGTLELRSYEGDHRGTALDAGAALGLGLGVHLGYGRDVSSLVEARYLQPGGGWTDWSACLAAARALA